MKQFTKWKQTKNKSFLLFFFCGMKGLLNEWFVLPLHSIFDGFRVVGYVFHAQSKLIPQSPSFLLHLTYLFISPIHFKETKDNQCWLLSSPGQRQQQAKQAKWKTQSVWNEGQLRRGASGS